jgi:hypothetical protein
VEVTGENDSDEILTDHRPRSCKKQQIRILMFHNSLTFRLLQNWKLRLSGADSITNSKIDGELGENSRNGNSCTFSVRTHWMSDTAISISAAYVFR